MMNDRDFNRMMFPEPPYRGPVKWGRVYGLLACGAVLLLFWTGIALLVADTAFASTPPMTMHVVTQGGVKIGHRQLSALEAANSRYSGLVHQYWGSPVVQFRSGQGIRVIVTGLGQMQSFCGQGAAACHGVGFDNQPLIIVGKYDRTWTLSVSHEIAETVVDPNVDRIVGPRYVEVCDPVESAYFRFAHNRSMMSDFATPEWFGLSSGGLFDAGGLLTQAAPQVLAGGYDPLTGYRHGRTATASPLLKRLIAMPR